MTFAAYLWALAGVMVGWLGRVAFVNWRERRAQDQLFADAIAEAHARAAVEQHVRAVPVIGRKNAA